MLHFLWDFATLLLIVFMRPICTPPYYWSFIALIVRHFIVGAFLLIVRHLIIYRAPVLLLG